MSATKTGRKQHSVGLNGVKGALKQEFVNAHVGDTLHGEILTWDAGDRSHKHADVVKALKNSGLNDKMAREILAQHAFTRAMKYLKEERVIDPLVEYGDIRSFQFTKRFLKEGEWKYGKDLVLELNIITGKVTCPNSKLEALAQQKLNDAIEDRTTSDITKIVQRLFDEHADLFPIRKQGGAYFVPSKFTDFTAQVQQFLNDLGGELNRFPVPKNTKEGDKSCQDAVVRGLSQIIADHESAVDNFSLDTRASTLESAAEKIKATRVKIEAYASYLEDKKQELFDALTASKAKLKAKIEGLTKERETAPVVDKGSNGSKRAFILGHPVSHVLRWMGRQNWSVGQATVVVTKLLPDGEVKSATISAKLSAGREKNKATAGPLAVLTEEQIAKLEAIRDGK